MSRERTAPAGPRSGDGSVWEVTEIPDWATRKQAFGSVAELYDRFRPGYPPELVDDVLGYAALDGAPALEAGAGTGKATFAFVDRGVAVTAVEPDPLMATVLIRHAAAGGTELDVSVTTFEEYRPEQPFGLLYSSQAWHWIDPATRWERAAGALRPGGALALFWNRDRPADAAVTAELKAAHDAHAPQVFRGHKRVEQADLAWPEIEDHPEFRDVEARLYRWRWTLQVADYVAYLGTQSAYVLLDDAVRDALFADITARLGDEVVSDVDTSLHLARRR